MHLLYGPSDIYTRPNGIPTDTAILDLLSKADNALSIDTIKYCLKISKDKAYRRLQSLARYGQVRLVTRKMTSFWKGVEEGE